MSYCKKDLDNSDIYVIATGDDYRCIGCPLVYPGFGTVEVVRISNKEMLKHLYHHRNYGHIVPQYAIDRLNEEINDEDNN